MWRRRDKCTGLKHCLISDLAVVLNTVTDDLASICSTSNGLRKMELLPSSGKGRFMLCWSKSTTIC